MRLGRLREDERIILAPIFMAIVLLVVFFGRMLGARSAVDGATRDAVRAASLARGAGAASSAASAAVEADLAGPQRVRCATWSTSTDVSGFRPGGTVTVTVACTVNLGDLGLLDLPGTKTLRATYSAPVDTYRGIG